MLLTAGQLLTFFLNSFTCFTEQDMKSKFHTLVESVKLLPETEQELQPGQTVQFGTTPPVTLRVVLLPLQVCYSRVSRPQRKELQPLLSKLGGQLHDAFTPDCTHLVTGGVADFTTKVISPSQLF
jgi:twin BRCT domain